MMDMSRRRKPKERLKISAVEEGKNLAAASATLSADMYDLLLNLMMKEQGEKERKRKDKAEAHLYTVIEVVSFLDKR